MSTIGRNCIHDGGAAAPGVVGAGAIAKITAKQLMSIFKKWSPNLKETRYLASLLRGEVGVASENVFESGGIEAENDVVLGISDTPSIVYGETH